MEWDGVGRWGGGGVDWVGSGWVAGVGKNLSTFKFKCSLNADVVSHVFLPLVILSSLSTTNYI